MDDGIKDDDPIYGQDSSCDGDSSYDGDYDSGSEDDDPIDDEDNPRQARDLSFRVIGQGGDSTSDDAYLSFHIITKIGKGYGRVFLAKEQRTGKLCALKKLVNRHLMEREILAVAQKSKNPWLVPLRYDFQYQKHNYLAMEYVPGGDFRSLLIRSGVLKEDPAIFYSSEMFTAVNSLHKLGYIHCDLKPEVTLIMKF